MMFGLVSFSEQNVLGEAPRIGAMIDADLIIDLQSAYQAYLALEQNDPHAVEISRARIPNSMIEFIRGGRQSIDAAKSAVAFFERAAPASPSLGAALKRSLSSVRLLPPLKPGKIVCAGRNYLEHARESSMPIIDDFPRGFIKVSSSLLGPFEDLPYPAATKMLDYEVELAVVIAGPAKDVAPENSYDCIYGYTVFNDVSARDWQYEERKKGNHLLGKNLDATGPLGPAIILKEFAPDPMALEVELRVNGDIRQKSSTSLMMFDIARLISHWSKMTLEPGDLIATGTPEGIAGAASKPQAPSYLRRGDIVEATVSGIGTLRNKIV